jgi:hypothetical protein
MTGISKVLNDLNILVLSSGVRLIYEIVITLHYFISHVSNFFCPFSLLSYWLLAWFNVVHEYCKLNNFMIMMTYYNTGSQNTIPNGI